MTTKTQYAFRKGARLQPGAKVTAQVIGTALSAVLDKHGNRATPAQVVKSARSVKSPLHPLFEWDDKKAAKEHRLDQARGLMRSVEVVYRKTEGGGPQHVRAFVNVKEVDCERTQFYTTTASALKSPDQRTYVLQTAWRRIATFRNEYGHLKEFSALFATLDEIEDTLPPVVTAG